MRYLVTVADLESEEEYVVEVEAPCALAAVVLVSGPCRRARSVVPECFVAGEAGPGADACGTVPELVRHRSRRTVWDSLRVY